MRVAILDDNKVLIGAADAAPGDDNPYHIPCGDLPTDGTYFWDGEKFMPVGRGRGKPLNPPVDSGRANYLLMRAVINGTPIPQECIDWCAWYERTYG